MKKLFRKEILIGLIVLVAMAVLFIGIDFLKGVNIFKAANYYYVSFDNVEGLAQSAPVTVNGFKVGLVRDISYEYDNPGHVLVELSLDRNLKVPSGSKAILATDLLGTASIALDMARTDSYHNVGDKLIGVVPKGMMDNVSNQLLPSVSAVIPKVDTLLTSINALVAHPAVLASVQRLDAITANLEKTTRDLNRLMATMPAITGDIKAITGNFNTASGDISQLTAQMREIPLDSVMANLQVISANLAELSAQLNDPNSTLGLMTHDPQLYNNLNSTVASLDSLFVDIKRNPKRYISIKLL
ncbi:MAG: MlaD family protein [Bacteroidales bacterium]|nr:MlaD family protein [Bacteroidales bacterium]